VGASDTALVSRDVDFLNIVRHELTHVVTRQATSAHIAGIPGWLNEGLSTYSQTRLLPDQTQALELAVRRNQTLPVATLDSYRSSSQVSLFYAQSGSVVSYLIERHGGPKFSELIAALRSDTLDSALQKTYGFNVDGLENEWRRALGLPPIENTGSQSSGPQQLPTLVPFGAPGSSSGSSATPSPNQPPNTGQTATGNDEGGSSTLPLIAGAAVAGLVIVAGGAYFVRRRARPAA
jgi:hypothetical protein